MADRKQIEERILQIISYIDHDKMLIPLVGSLKLFSLEELLQLKEFLETWDYKPIYLLLDKKIKEYLIIVKEIKQIQIRKKMDKIKNDEISEKNKEEQNLEKILEF